MLLSPCRDSISSILGSTTLADSAWRRFQLPVEKPWSAPGGPFVCFLAQTGVENTPFTL